MANDMCTRRLRRELQALLKNPMKNPTIVATPHESNILEWHYVIEGSKGTPYEGGFYHGKLVFPKEYPLKPPSVLMLTPSGRFKPNRRLCLSMSDFHPESWNPMWSVSTILTGLYSFMIESAPTLGSIETTTAQKRRLARQSLDFNVRDADFGKLFTTYVELHSERQRKLIAAGGDAATDSSRSAASLASGGAAGAVAVGDRAEQMQGLVTLATAVVAILSLLFAMKLM